MKIKELLVSSVVYLCTIGVAKASEAYEKLGASSIRFVGDDNSAMTSLAQTSMSNPLSPFHERRLVMIILSILLVLLYWLVLSQFALPESKEANIKLKVIEQETNLSEFDKLVIMNQIKKREKTAGSKNDA